MLSKLLVWPLSAHSTWKKNFLLIFSSTLSFFFIAFLAFLLADIFLVTGANVAIIHFCKTVYSSWRQLYYTAQISRLVMGSIFTCMVCPSVGGAVGPDAARAHALSTLHPGAHGPQCPHSQPLTRPRPLLQAEADPDRRRGCHAGTRWLKLLSSTDILGFGNSRERTKLFLCRDGRSRWSSSWRGKEECYMHTVGNCPAKAGYLTGFLFCRTQASVSIWSISLSVQTLS